MDVNQAFKVENLKSFILSDGTPAMAGPSLMKFYNYVYSEIFKQTEYLPFPVQSSFYRKRKAKVLLEENNSYFPRGYNFSQLFDDELFMDFRVNNFQIAMKASLAVCLGAAYDTSEIEQLEVSDFHVDNYEVKVRNINSNINAYWIVFNEQFSEYIRTFYNIRINQHTNSKLFFEKIWSHKDTSK